MTPVVFCFVSPDGLPISNADVEIQLTSAGFDPDRTGIALPRPVYATTGDDGVVTVELEPLPTLYRVTVFDSESDATHRYKFYVPAVSEGEQVRFQDIVVDAPVSSTTYDEAALLAIQNTKVAVLTAKAAVDTAVATLRPVYQAGGSVNTSGYLELMGLDGLIYRVAAQYTGASGSPAPAPGPSPAPSPSPSPAPAPSPSPSPAPTPSPTPAPPAPSPSPSPSPSPAPTPAPSPTPAPTPAPPSVAPMPEGPTLLYYADALVVADGRAMVPNAASGVPVPTTPNLLQLPRRAFSGPGSELQGVMVTGPVTITEGVAGPDGKLDATRIAADDNLWYVFANPFNTAAGAGTYSLGFNARWPGTGPRSFKMGDFNGTMSGVLNLPEDGSWARFFFSFAKGGNAMAPIIISSDGNTGINMDIRDLELYKGSVDPGEFIPAGHMYLGRDVWDTRVKLEVPGVVDYATAGGYGTAQVPLGAPIAAMTFLAMVKKVEGAGTNFASLLVDRIHYGTFGQFIDKPDSAGAPMGAYSASFGGDHVLGVPGLWNLLDSYHCIAYRHDNAHFSVWADGLKLWEEPATAQTFAISDFLSGLVLNESFTSGAKWNSMALYPRALTDNEMGTATDALIARAQTSSLQTWDGTFFAALGDSITFGYNVTNLGGSYADLYGRNSTQPDLFGINQGVSGTGLVDFSSNRLPLLLPSLAKRTGKKNIVTVQIGANDMLAIGAEGGWASVSAWANALAANCDTLRAAGALVAVGTLLPRTDGDSGGNAMFEANRSEANNIIRTWVGVHCDAVFDFAADATMGAAGASDNTTYYQDKVHPTAAGQALLLNVFKPVIDAL